MCSVTILAQVKLKLKKMLRIKPGQVFKQDESGVQVRFKNVELCTVYFTLWVRVIQVSYIEACMEVVRQFGQLYNMEEVQSKNGLQYSWRLKNSEGRLQFFLPYWDRLPRSITPIRNGLQRMGKNQLPDGQRWEIAFFLWRYRYSCYRAIALF